jgi:hypothetical protein
MNFYSVDILPEEWKLSFQSLWNKLRRRKHLSVDSIHLICTIIAIFLRLSDAASSRQVPPSTSTSTSPPPPWGEWELDPIFFKTLSRWTHDNPESTLDRVLQNVCDGYQIVKEIMNVVPDSPFPARSLIGALAHLVQLGAVRDSS